jgi:membrane-associated phospholipid phosphatase
MMGRLPWHIIVLLLGAFAASMAWADLPLASWIDAHQTDASRLLGHWLEEIGKSHWVLLYCIGVTAVAWRSRRDEAHKHVQLFTAVAASGILANLVKVLTCRPRPPLFIEHGITAWDLLAFRTEFLWNSFPSGHATTGLSIAIVGSYVYPRLRHAFWIVGISIALGRIMLNVHYLSDVVAGSLLGALVSGFVISRWRR